MQEILEVVKNYTVSNNHQWYVYLLATAILCSMDVLSGVFNAFMKGNLQSKEFKRGAIGKTAILCIVGLSMLLDYVFSINYLFISTCIFYIVEESLSVLENLGDYIKIPRAIKIRLTELNKEDV